MLKFLQDEGWTRPTRETHVRWCDGEGEPQGKVHAASWEMLNNYGQVEEWRIPHHTTAVAYAMVQVDDPVTCKLCLHWLRRKGDEPK